MWDVVVCKGLRTRNLPSAVGEWSMESKKHQRRCSSSCPFLPLLDVVAEILSSKPLVLIRIF